MLLLAGSYLPETVKPEARSQGFDGFVVKPYSLEQLSQALHDLLREGR